jgi:hypothetical protein
MGDETMSKVNDYDIAVWMDRHDSHFVIRYLDDILVGRDSTRGLGSRLLAPYRGDHHSMTLEPERIAKCPLSTGEPIVRGRMLVHVISVVHAAGKPVSTAPGCLGDR